jgi:hypothetical protein
VAGLGTPNFEPQRRDGFFLLLLAFVFSKQAKELTGAL